MKMFLRVVVALIVSAGLMYADGVPNPPEHLTVGKVPGGALLQWDPSDVAMGYRIYKSMDTLSQFMRIGQEMGPHFTDPMVPPGHTYRYYVTAFNGMGESSPSDVVVFTPDSTPPPILRAGTIDGKVVDDSTGQPIPGVRIQFFRTNGFLYFREVRTDSLGFYSAMLDTGLYFVYASRIPYIPEWFDNVHELDSATHVPVTTGDTSTANFALHPIPPPPPPVLANISGTVRDSVANAPLQGAYVVALRTERDLAQMRDDDGPSFGSRADMISIPEMGNVWGVVFAARTDSLGHYTLKLPLNQRFVLLSAKLGYIPQFYYHQQAYEDADIVSFGGDSTGFNFDLAPNPVLNNSISGTVADSSGTGVVARVVLYSFNPVSMTPFPRIEPIRCTSTDSLGNYTFGYLFPSSLFNRYFVKAFPLGFYAPAWYSVDSCGVREWRGADSIPVHGNTTGINVCVKQFKPEGVASISGHVMMGGGVNGLQGSTVYAVSMQTGQVGGYDVSADGGTFTIQNLAPGDYQVVVDKEGYQADQTPVYTVDASNSYTVSNASISVSAAVLGVVNHQGSTPVSYALSQNYPNPFNPTTSIAFALPADSRVTITVYNLLGQRVATLLTQDMNAGTYSVTWNGLDAGGHSASSGVYFYEMNARSLAGSSQYTAVMKMLLVK